MPDLGDASICWRLEHWDMPPDPQARLSELRRAVRGRPDHPGHAEIRRLERLVRHDPPASLRCLWSRDSEHWRCNMTYEGGAYIDLARDGGTVWMLKPHGLAVADAGAVAEDIPEFQGALYTFWPELSRIVFGGLSAGVISHLSPGPVRWDGERWRVRLSLESEGEEFFASELQGTWHAEADRGFVEKSTIVQAANADAIGATATYTGWRFVAEVGRWVAERVEERAPDGRLERAYAFVSASAGETGEFRRMIELPLDRHSDPVRGELTYTRLEDHRRGVSRERDPQTGEMGRPEALPGRTFRDVWRSWLGWVAAAALSTGLIGLYIRRSWGGA
jgi:hypothetical protein